MKHAKRIEHGIEKRHRSKEIKMFLHALCLRSLCLFYHPNYILPGYLSLIC